MSEGRDPDQSGEPIQATGATRAVGHASVAVTIDRYSCVLKGCGKKPLHASMSALAVRRGRVVGGA
jgi:hypothetical protein